MSERTLLAIVGPTATGKTALAVEMAPLLAEAGFGAPEVIGADSRQVYRGMDVGTAKPSARERSLVPHHLVDIIEPDEPFSLAQWLELARAALEDVWARGGLPLLVGGTGQYVWALLEGWRVPRVPPRVAFRRRMEARDPAELFAEVRAADPAAAERIGPFNVRRLVRALEVREATGRPISYWQTKDPPDFRTLVVGLQLPREELYRRIDERVDSLLAAGLIDETRALLARGYSRDLPSMSGIGYKEACAHIEGELTPAEAAGRIKTETHRLARHQNAWFKPDDGRIRWLDAGPDAARHAVELASGELGPVGARGTS